MAQYYRNQNESGRGPDHSRGGYRNVGGRDRFETGSEHRYTPDVEDRFYEGSNQSNQYDHAGAFEGDRSYSASGYPEEFGYRRENYPDRGRGQNPRFGDQERFTGSYNGPAERYGRNQDDFNRGRSDYGTGPRASVGASSSTHGAQAYGAQGNFGRDYGNERSGASEQPWQSQPSQRGRGPKGYERSDERLKEMICERLTDDPVIDASEVAIEVINKTVKLTGTVDDRRIKYLIEDVIEQCGGVRDIDNQVRVQAQPQTSQHGTGTGESAYTGRSVDYKATLTGTPATKRN